MVTPDPQVVLKLAQKIVDAKAALTILEKQWEDYFPGATKSPKPNRGGRRADPDSMAGKIASFLNDHATASYTAKSVADLLKIDHKQAERSLFKLFKSGKIARPNRGVYAALAYRKPTYITPLENAA